MEGKNTLCTVAPLISMIFAVGVGLALVFAGEQGRQLTKAEALAALRRFCMESKAD